MSDSLTDNNEWFDPSHYSGIEWKYVKQFLSYCKFMRFRLLLAILLSFLFSASAFFIPKLFAEIQHSFQTRNEKLFIYAAVAYLGIALFQSSMNYFILRVKTNIYTRLNKHVLLTYYKKILNISVMKFLEIKQDTNLFQRLMDVMLITQQATSVLIGIVLGVVTIVVFGWVIFNLSISVFVVLLAGTVILFTFLTSRLHILQAKHQITLGINYPLVSKMLEIINGALTIKALSGSIGITRDISELVEAKKKAEYDEAVYQSQLSFVSDVLKNIVLLSCIFLSFWLLLQDRLSLSQVFAIYVLVNGFLAPVQELTSHYQSLSVISVNFKNYLTIIAIEDENDSVQRREVLSSRATKGVRIHGEIEFDGVDFCYDSSKTVLRNLSFHVSPGEKIALIGKSGAGKTTILRLMLSFLQPQKGKILIDGMDLAEIRDKNSYRSILGVVNQSDFLFNISIKENLLFALNGRSLDVADIASILMSVNLWNDINRLEKGLDTVYYDELFSGGQRQRLLIARALIREPRIILLDEPTSSLDFENEKKIIEALDLLVKDKTSIIIAHKLSTIKSADRVLLLDAGRIVASGRHEDLYRNSDYYKSLCDYNSFIV